MRGCLVGLVVLGVIAGAGASAFGQGLTGSGPAGFNDSGIHNGGPRNGNGGQLQPPTGPKPVLAPIPLHADPWQRLDRGALICETEADLEQHQAAVSARLEGRPASEPTGCHVVRQMVAVGVLTRHGPARTEVSLPDSFGMKSGWTDQAIPRDKPLSH